jgi:effector-binding domain-containing protein
MYMQIKEIKPISFLYFRTETTLGELGTFVGGVAKDLFREAVKHDLSVTGPVQWHYFGFTDPQKPFTLEIALPVDEVLPEYDGAFHFKRTEPFKCLTLVHEGSWLEMTQSYGKLMQHIAGQKLQPVGVNREVYMNVDFSHPEANVTEIQIGIV